MQRTPFLAMRVDVRRGDVLAAVEADVGVAQVVGEEDDDVGLSPRIELGSRNIQAGGIRWSGGLQR